MAHPTNADIIRRASRLLGSVASGQDPTGTRATEAMERLQSVMLDQPGLLLRARWCDKTITADYEAKESYRITPDAAGYVVTLPETITPVGGCTRRPLNFARVQILGDVDNAGLWVYVASLGEWRQVDGRASGDEFPFGLEDVDGMSAQLAVALQDEYGANYQAGPRTVAKSAQSIAAFRARFMKAQPYDWTRPSDYAPSACNFPDYC